MSIVPTYIFEASVTCLGPSLTREERKGLLSILEGELLSTSWTRDGMNFVKRVICATGDLAAAEDEFITALKTCAEVHMAPGQLTSLSCTFNSTTISLIDPAEI